MGYGKVTPEHAYAAIYPEAQPADATSESLSDVIADASAQARRLTKRSVGGVRVQGEADIVVRFAKCCSPVPVITSWPSSAVAAVSSCTL